MNSNNYIEQKKNTHLYFSVGGNKYAVNSDNVLEIMKRVSMLEKAERMFLFILPTKILFSVIYTIMNY